MQGLDIEQPFIIEEYEAFSEDECIELISKIESLDPKLATINTAAGAAIDQGVRNNDRVIFEDMDLANRVLSRVGDSIPKRIDGRNLVGANERFRCYRYQPGMKFAPHMDGSYVRNTYERSYYSVLVYLNGDFEGGETTFFTDPMVVVKPEAGLIAMFQHPILHEGSIVTSGVKYVARTDLMYSINAPE